MTDAKVAEAARRWVLARERAAKLRAKRAGLECAREGAEPDRIMRGLTPCWKTWLPDPEGRDCLGNPTGDTIRLPDAEWCESCREREVVHGDYRRATASRGAAERVLLRFAKAQVTP